MATQTKCVATMAGPFARYGGTLVKVCVESGTDYVDITGQLSLDATTAATTTTTAITITATVPPPPPPPPPPPSPPLLFIPRQGETHWVREMIATYDDAARASGARIVHHCGHDR